MTKFERRGLKIVELMEEVETAKKIIEGFVWPGDESEGQGRRKLFQAATFAGCPLPVFAESTDINKETDDIPSDIEPLMRFYEAGSLLGLIREQAAHIERLQEKLGPVEEPKEPGVSRAG